MLRSCQIIIRDLCSFAKVILQYSQFNSYLQTRFCGSILYCVWMCCGAVARCAYDAHLATAPQHIHTQYSMLPQNLVFKYELNCEYCNITLARNRAPWWWSDKIETCRSVLKVFNMKLYARSLVDKLKWSCQLFNKNIKIISTTADPGGPAV